MLVNLYSLLVAAVAAVAAAAGVDVLELLLLVPVTATEGVPSGLYVRCSGR